MLTARAQQQEITVEAALTGDRELAVQALALDPLVPDPRPPRAILHDAALGQRRRSHGGVRERLAAHPR